MFEFLLGLALGLVIGWNFLPQPVWVSAQLARLGLGSAKPTAPDSEL